MLTLALDTSTPPGSAAMTSVETDVLTLDPDRPLATQVPAALVTLLECHGRNLRDIEVFAVCTGPGSFTGLRIGIATMQGLALANGKPLIGVSAFDALVDIASARLMAPSVIHAWIDAWRGEVYAATYATGTPDDVAPRMIDEPTVDAPEALVRGSATASPLDDARGALSGSRRAAVTTRVFIGNGAVRYRDLIGPQRVLEPTPLLAGAIAHLALRRAAHGEASPPHAIRPLYVRRPDAEIVRERSSRS